MQYASFSQTFFSVFLVFFRRVNFLSLKDLLDRDLEGSGKNWECGFFLNAPRLTDHDKESVFAGRVKCVDGSGGASWADCREFLFYVGLSGARFGILRCGLGRDSTCTYSS